MSLPPIKLPTIAPKAAPVEAEPTALQAMPTQDKSLQMVNTDVSTFYDLIVNGNISKLSQEQRVVYYNNVCKSLGLNPITKPLAFIELNDKGQKKLTLYALKEAAVQLAQIHSVSCEILRIEVDKQASMAFCDVRTKDPSGRFNDETGAIAWSDKLTGENAAIQRMKLVTKAKRRAILSHCGLGILDEAEVESMKDAKPVQDTPVVLAAAKPVENTPQVSVATPAESTKVDQSPAAQPQPISPPPPVQTEESFNYNNNEDRQWLIGEVKATFPAANRENIIAVCGTFAKHESKRTVKDILARRKKHEEELQAKGEPNLLDKRNQS
jgi:hypothetical protein